MRRSREPLLWAMFSAGGMLTAFVLPALVFVLWIAAPLGWVEPPSRSYLLSVVRSPAVRLLLLGFITLSLFDWAHRFRYTLYDGLQLYHLNQLIAVVTYGIATVLTLFTSYVLWILPGP